MESEKTKEKKDSISSMRDMIGMSKQFVDFILEFDKIGKMLVPEVSNHVVDGAKLLREELSKFSFLGGSGAKDRDDIPDGNDEDGMPYKLARFSCGLMTRDGKKFMTIDFAPDDPKKKPIVLDMENASKVIAVMAKVFHEAECSDCQNEKTDAPSVH